MIRSNLISIILPVYNGEKYLSEAIQSCLNQTYRHFELLIINDCSTDSTLEIATKYEKLDNRIRIINNVSNLKLPASLNIGHNKAQGEFLLWTSHDNRFKPLFLEKVLNAKLENKADIVYCNYDIILESGTIKREHKSGPISHLIFGNTVGSAFIYDRRVFQKLGGYDEHLHTIEDYDFWVRAALNFNFFHLAENLYQYRIHEHSLTSQTINNQEGLISLNSRVVEIFKKIEVYLEWHPETTYFLLKLPRHKMLLFFKENSLKIIEDLNKFQAKVSENSDSESTDKLYYLLRQYLKSTKAKFDLGFLIWVLLNHSKILFHKSYSRKETLKLVSRFI